MAEIRVKENESLDSALRRFKRQCARSGVLQELRKREHYEKPSVKRKKTTASTRHRRLILSSSVSSNNLRAVIAIFNRNERGIPCEFLFLCKKSKICQ